MLAAVWRYTVLEGTRLAHFEEEHTHCYAYGAYHYMATPMVLTLMATLLSTLPTGHACTRGHYTWPSQVGRHAYGHYRRRAARQLQL